MILSYLRSTPRAQPTTSTNTPAIKISIGSGRDEIKLHAEAIATAQEDKIKANTNPTEMKDESVRPEQKFPRLNSSTTRNGAPSTKMVLLLNIVSVDVSNPQANIHEELVHTLHTRRTCTCTYSYVIAYRPQAHAPTRMRLLTGLGPYLLLACTN